MKIKRLNGEICEVEEGVKHYIPEKDRGFAFTLHNGGYLKNVYLNKITNTYFTYVDSQ